MKLVGNGNGLGHDKAIMDVINEADDITIAVAFLKLAGAQYISDLLERRLLAGAKAEAFIGTDFFLTEPKALERLLILKDAHSKFTVFIADQGSSTFHPKAYVGRQGDQCRCLVGSANLTSGGLRTNEELSVYLEHSKGDPFSVQLGKEFARYRKNKRFQKLDQLVLQQYTSRFEVSQRVKKKFEKELSAALPNSFDLRKIEEFYSRYKVDKKAIAELVQRRKKRIEALKVQKAICMLNKSYLSAKDRENFQSHLRDLMTSNGGRHLWNSGDIYRRGSEALDHPKEVIAFFVLAQSSARYSPIQGYEKIRKAADDIPGVGLNMATEILCTFAPNSYAVYNGNTAGALKALGIAAPNNATFSSITPVRYANLCSTIEALKTRINGTNFIEADAFLNWVYWQTKTNK